ncbi:hypothetical protein JW758_06095, partial [Candidatus Peregrinibacteria bacterium]|nr:hypothetical protein [Candidatus Peregrinibacteria bacterium]
SCKTPDPKYRLVSMTYNQLAICSYHGSFLGGFCNLVIQKLQIRKNNTKTRKCAEGQKAEKRKTGSGVARTCRRWYAGEK